MSAEVPDAALAAHARADACIDARRFEDAIAPAEEALRIAPAWGAPWWNLSVAYKHARRWADALRASERAIGWDPDDVEAMHWNAGIAATALGKWTRARAAWRAVGLEVPGGDDDVQLELGLAPVRLAPAEAAEVVWCQRIDPCRARIQNVPTPAAGRRFGDLVLHDGEPRGQRTLGGREVAVFDELALLEASPFRTWEVELEVASEAALRAIVAALEQTTGSVEDWTASIRPLCAACSLGTPHDHREVPDEATGWSSRRILGVAARSESELAPLRTWFRRWRREVRSVERVL